jgi:hypothetical protein
MGERTLEEMDAGEAEPQGHLDMADLGVVGGSDV